MSSPPKEADTEVPQTPDENKQPDDTNNPMDDQTGAEIEVKEQDRWLPIANGTFHPRLLELPVWCPLCHESC